MATPIATGALKPKTAVLLAAILNLIGALLSTEVAKTISGGIIREGDGGVQITPEIIFAGLIGAITWNMFTWLKGLPSSSSHALFGGLIGAAIVGAGFGAVDYGVLTSKVLLPALLAPLIAALIAIAATKFAYKITRRFDGLPDGRNKFKKAQIFSSSLVALSHGTNDAQKTMGVITLALIAGGFQMPGSGPEMWVVLVCAFAIALGTYLGGWRIMRTIGSGLTSVKPTQGFAAETSTAATILASSHLGFALSTTQVASGSVIGSGIGRRGSKVKWKNVRKIALGWLLTIPAAAAVGVLAAFLATGFGMVGVIIDAVLGFGVILGIYLYSRKDKVDHENVYDDPVSSLKQAAKAVKHKRNLKPLKRRHSSRRAEVIPAAKPKKRKHHNGDRKAGKKK